MKRLPPAQSLPASSVATFSCKVHCLVNLIAGDCWVLHTSTTEDMLWRVMVLILVANVAARQILHLLLTDEVVCIEQLVLQEVRAFSHHQQAAIKAFSMDTTNRLQLQQQLNTH
jgi:hypothetical protein